jgi:drug/metabolite transporter (DMT)-like permease
MGPRFLVLWWLAWALAFSRGGDYFAKVWVLRSSWSIAALALAFYAAASVAWMLSLRQYGQLATLGVVFSAISLVACVATGMLIFGEHISPRQIVGLVLALLACLLAF